MRAVICSLALAMAIPGGALAQTAPQGRAKPTPDWPCRAIKVAEISLPAVWSGPPVDGVKTADWREDPVIGALVERLALRRTPMEQAEAAIEEFATKAGAAKQEKLVVLFAGLFQSMAHERAQVIAGLDRFGRRQKELADAIRGETAEMRAAQDQPGANPEKLQELVNRLTWDMRIFEDKRKSVAYVCETPVLIEQRLFALGRAIAAQL